MGEPPDTIQTTNILEGAASNRGVSGTGGGSQSQIGVAVINWLLEGPQQNHYVSRKGLGALTKKNPVPHLEFYYFGFQMENNFQKHNFVVARLCEPMRFPDVP